MTGLLDTIETPLDGFEALCLNEGDYLFAQGDAGEALYIVTSGRLKVLIDDEQGGQLQVGFIEEGEPVGEMQVFTGGKRTATVVADQATELIQLPADQINTLQSIAPALYQEIEHLILRRLRRNHLLLLLPDLFGEMSEQDLSKVEAELDWRDLKKGERLIQQGDKDQEMFIVLSGRLQVLVADENGQENAVLEIGRGETVGEMALFNDDPRAASVDALRDTMLVSISKSAFFSTLTGFPKLHEHITRVVMRRLRNVAQPINTENQVENVIVIPLHPTVDVSRFTSAIATTLTQYGSTLCVNKKRFCQLANFRPASKWFEEAADRLRLTVWLDKVERHHRFILFEGDSSASGWTRRLIQHADRILLLADATQSPAITNVEQSILKNISPSQQILVLQHPIETTLPEQTINWLRPRAVRRHFNVRKGHNNDEARMGRFLAGKSIGLVLGGGGARGFAHIGIIKAFREAGIPIDMIGGTSMGGVLAAHTAMELSIEEMIYRNRRAFVEERPFRKALLPMFSIYKSKKLDEVTHQIMYKEACLEDFWLPCFMISCSLGTSEMVVHERGKAWEAVRASTALPGIVAPVSDGQFLHVDGGLMNNLPVDVMQERCAGPIAAVEASDMTDLDARGLRLPSIMSHLKNRWFGSSDKKAFPGLLEVLMRSLLLGSIKQVKQVKSQVDLMLSPPVDKFGLLAFEAIEEIVEVGYTYGLEKVPGWEAVP